MYPVAHDLHTIGLFRQDVHGYVHLEHVPDYFDNRGSV